MIITHLQIHSLHCQVCTYISNLLEQKYFVTDIIIKLIILFTGNIDLMSGMNAELRDENAEGNYAFYLSLSRHCHTHTSTRTAAPPANLFLAYLRIEPAVEESARVSYRVRWLGARVSDDARPTRTDRKRRRLPNTARIVPPAEARRGGRYGTIVVLFKC